jgi:murein DD-endopeptidase MepM/ murein hydrolase activator NlpD
MRRVAGLVAAGALLFAAPALASPAFGAGSPSLGRPSVAALQVALHLHGIYRGTIDGLAGPATARALVTFQRRKGLVPDGVAGPATRSALGPFARPDLGIRTLSVGDRGWDVAELQFELAWHGFPSGTLDGVFGPHVEAAVRRFQRYAGLPAVGRAGPRTMTALRAPLATCPLHLQWPVRAPLGALFGPRGMRFHTGVDIEAAMGTPVGAARGGEVTWAGFVSGYGMLVVVAHGSGVRTLYAHLSRIDVRVGQRVLTGQQLGLVGATGDATGPHLHFEVRVRGAAVDPLPALR